MKKVVDGVLYVDKEIRKTKAKLMGRIDSIEKKVDKRGNNYYAVFILNAGEKEAIRWNFFNEKGKVFKKNDLILA
ncbi:hypothetical protein LCGC14_3064990, partial [marine sediment metagenome]